MCVLTGTVSGLSALRNCASRSSRGCWDGTLDKGVLDGVVWPKDEAGRTLWAGAETGVPGPWTGAGDPRARLEGGWGRLAGRVEPGVPTDVVEVELGPNGDAVPATEPTEVGSAAKMSPWVDGTPPPKSMKRDRSFISRAWMSSTLPCDSVDASDLASHSPQFVCVCPARVAVCGWE